MSEFDDMLRAGLISPGSQPRVESKRTPAVERGRPPATITVVSETRTSGPVEVERGVPFVPAPSPRRPFVVIVGGERLDNARKAKDALSYHYHCHVTRPLTDFKRQFPRAVLIIATADAPALGDALRVGLPVLVLANPDEAAGAAERIGGRTAAVELLPINPTSLLAAVGKLLPPPHVDAPIPVPAAAPTAVAPIQSAAEFNEQLRAGSPAPPPFVVILGGERLDRARQAKNALSSGYQCHVTRPLTEFWQRYPRAQMVVVAADAPVLRDALELGLPVLVLATAEEAVEHAPLLEGREGVAVATSPLDPTELAAAAAKLLAPGARPAPRATAEAPPPGPRSARARVLVLSSDVILGGSACAALEGRCAVEHGSDRRDIARAGPWDLVVVAGALDRVALTKALARKLPLVLVPAADEYELAHTLALIPNVVVVPAPDLHTQLLEEVEQLVGVWTRVAGRVRHSRARVLILSNDFFLGQRAGTALEKRCTVNQTSDRKILSGRLHHELVVMVGDFDGADDVSSQNVPLVLIPWSNGYLAANALAQHPRVAVVSIADIETLLLSQVEAFVGVWTPDG